MKNLLILIIITLCLLSNPAFATSNITLQNAKLNTVMEIIKKDAMVNNHVINSITPNSISISLPTTIMESTLYGSNWNGTPSKIQYITLLQDGNNVIAQVTVYIITNPGSAFQQISSLPYREAKYIEALNYTFNPRYTYGFYYIPRRKFLEITNINEKEILLTDKTNPLRIGDKIIDIKPIGFYNVKRYGLVANEKSPNELILLIQNQNDIAPREIKIKKNLIIPKF